MYSFISLTIAALIIAAAIHFGHPGPHVEIGEPWSATPAAER